MTTMAGIAQPSKTVEMDEVRALQVELEAANKKIQQCNDTSTSPFKIVVNRF